MCCAIPTAVITLSREKIMSKIEIWIIVPSKFTLTKFGVWFSFLCEFSCEPLTSEWISIVDFAIKKSPPKIKMISLPEISTPKTLNKGFVSFITQKMLKSNKIRVTIASASPPRRATRCFSRGKREHKIAIKMMLSTPKIISSPVNVARLIHACGEVKISIIKSPNLR